MKEEKKEKWISAIAIFVLGCLLILGLFFWYKSFAYYTHDIHTYDVVNPIENDSGQMIFTLERLKRYYETAITNNSASDITASVYLNGSNPILLQDDIRIAGGEVYWFDSYEYAYKVVISGESITEDNIKVEASTLRYLKDYRKSVVITMIAGIALTVIWTALTIAAPEKVKKYGVKINMVMACFLSAGSIVSSLIFYRGYYESNLCFLALLCTVFVAALKHEKTDTAVVLQGEAYLAAGILSMLFSCLMLATMFNSTDASPLYFFNARNKMSLPDYAITVVVFVVLFMALSAIFLKNGKIVVFLKNCCLGKEPAVCGAAVTAAFLVQQETLGMAGNIGYFLCVILISAVVYFLYFKADRWKSHYQKLKKLISGLVYVSYILTIVAATISTTVINYFHMGERTEDYVHHVGWYYRQLYYMANNLSFPSDGIGLYGHYGLFYKLPMSIFGSNLLTIGVITGLIGGLTALFAIGIIHKLTKSDLLRIIGAVTIMNIFSYKLYLAIVPHRLLFPMMILFYIVLCKKQPLRWFHILTGFLISALSILWNTETGVVVLITWIAFWILKKVVEKNWQLAQMIRMIAMVAGIVVLAAVIVAAGFILYNVSILGMAVEKLFGVLLDPGYMFAAHFNFIRWTNAPWIYIMVLLLGMLAYGMSGMGLLGAKIEKKPDMPVIIAIAVMGLGQMTYFISRPEDYSIMILPAVFCMIILLNGIHQDLERKKILGAILIFGFSCIMAGTGDNVRGIYSRCIEHHQLDYGLLKEDLAVFADQVPEDSYVMDDGLTEIYLCLGWEMPQDKKTVEYMIKGYMIEDTDYQLIKEIPFGDIKYFLYRNNNY